MLLQTIGVSAGLLILNTFLCYWALEDEQTQSRFKARIPDQAKFQVHATSDCPAAMNRQLITMRSNRD
jgi:hypothetical protein